MLKFGWNAENTGGFGLNVWGVTGVPINPNSERIGRVVFEVVPTRRHLQHTRDRTSECLRPMRPAWSLIPVETRWQIKVRIIRIVGNDNTQVSSLAEYGADWCLPAQMWLSTRHTGLFISSCKGGMSMGFAISKYGSGQVTGRWRKSANESVPVPNWRRVRSIGCLDY